MRPESTGKSDPQQPAPAKRGFFAAAGERLKRAMSAGRAPAAAPAQASSQESSADADGADGEVTTSVQAKARELLQQDRTRRRDSAGPSEEMHGARERRTSPPPLPSQRTAADAISGSSDRPSTARPKRPVRDSKSEALRARLGAAKAALAEAQAKRAAEQAVAEADAPQLKAATAQDADGGEPIRTLTIARLLASQGYYDRSLSIYDELLSENAEDTELRAEAEKVRAQQANHQRDETI